MKEEEVIEKMYIYLSKANRLLEAISLLQYEIGWELNDLQVQEESLRDYFTECRKAVASLQTYEHNQYIRNTDRKYSLIYQREESDE